MDTISIIGSCISRDLFNSKVISDYKKFFELYTYHGRSTFISLMQEPFSFNKKDIELENKVDTTFIEDDFKKEGINRLAKYAPNYLMIDILFDVIFGVICLNDGNIISNNTWNLPKTSFYKYLNHEKDFKILTIADNSQKYFNLYKNSIDLFFDFLDEYCENTKVILNSVRLVSSYVDVKGDVVNNNSRFKNECFDNIYFLKLENYIIDNFDVSVMTFNNNYLADASHMWGLAPHHYEKSFYRDKFNKLKDIVFKDKISNNNILLEGFKNLVNENVLLNMRNRILDDEKNFFKRENINLKRKTNHLSQK